MYFLFGKYMTGEAYMHDAARDPAAMELLRVQRSRLADRMRPPWWYMIGATIGWALVFACPFATRYLPRGGYWAIVVAALAVACLLQWGMDRATGLKVGPRPLRVLRDGIFYYRPGRPYVIAMLLVSLAATVTEASLIGSSLLMAAIIIAVIAVVLEVALQRTRLRGIRQELRDGLGAT